MSKIALSGNPSGTGTFTIASPNSNTDRTLNLPDVSATLITDSAGILNIGSGQLFKDANGNVGIGTSSPTANTRLDIVSPSNNQQYVDVLRLKTSSSGDFHPAILFENNRNSVDNAAKISMDSGSSAGSGIFVFQTKNSSGTFVNRMALLSDGNLQFNSGYGSVATAYGCRAWVNFNGQSSGAIRASGNVSSVTQNGTGDFTINFATAMPDVNYGFCGGVKEGGGSAGTASNRFVFPDQPNPNTSSYRVITANQTITKTNDAYVMCHFFR
jgi:hypothetical protein